MVSMPAQYEMATEDSLLQSASAYKNMLESVGQAGAAQSSVDQYNEQLRLYAPNFQVNPSSFGGEVDQPSLYDYGEVDAWAVGQLPDVAFTNSGYRIDPATGAIIYTNGVVAVPSENRVIMPVGRTAFETRGTPEWLSRRSSEWDKDKINEWRKKLYDAGFDVERKGGWALDLQGALAQYYTAYYLNYGEDVKLAPGAKDNLDDEAMLDSSEIRGSVRSQFIATLGDDPSPEELDDFEQWFRKEYTRLQRRKGLSPERALGITQAKMVEDLSESEAYEDNEETTELADAIAGAAQLEGAFLT
jgi:hypothetical protein